MVVGVEQRGEEEGWDAGPGVGEMVAAEIPAFDVGGLVIVGVEEEFGAFLVGGEAHGYQFGGIAVGRCRAEERCAVGAVAADHVTVEDGDERGSGDGGVYGIPAGAKQAAFFGAVPDEEGGAAAGFFVEGAGDGHEGYVYAGIVVGAVEDGIGAGDIADAVMIEVAAEDYVLIF